MNCGGVTNYSITLSDIETSTVVQTQITEETFYKFDDLDPFTNYSIVVVATNQQGLNSTESDPDKFTTQTIGKLKFYMPRLLQSYFGFVRRDLSCILGRSKSVKLCQLYIYIYQKYWF